MKKLIVSLFLVGIVFGASAQSGHVVASTGVKRVYVVRPQIVAGVYSPFYGPFGYYGYPFIYTPFGYYPYYPYGMGYSRPTELQKKEEDIRADYQDRIYSVRQDSSLSPSEKRQTIRSLKKQRKQDIKDLVANYHRRPLNENGKSEKSQSVE
jgi:hypothetical protein